MTRHVTQREMTEDQRGYFDAWMVYHGVNLAEAHTLEFTKQGYIHIFYREGPDMIVNVELETPAWL